VKNKILTPGWTYILRCSDESYYVGSTTNLVQRMNEHIMGVFKGYTSTRLPIELVYSQAFENINEAMAFENS
jgi:predicted GIY-YIG superfamily endonuclease